MSEANSIACDSAQSEPRGHAESQSYPIGALAGRSLLGASVNVYVFLFALWLRMPAYDEAKSAGPLAFVFDPLVLWVAMPVGVVGAVCAFALAFLWRGRVNSRKAVTFISVSTWCATAFGALVFGKYGIPIAFATLFTSSVICRFARWSWLTRPDPQPN